MIRARGLGVAGWEGKCVPHRRIRYRLDSRLILATRFSPHMLSWLAGIPQHDDAITELTGKPHKVTGLFREASCNQALIPGLRLYSGSLRILSAA